MRTRPQDTMDQRASGSRLFCAEFLIAFGMAGAALLLYLATLSRSLFPGLPARQLIEHLALDGSLPVLDLFWGMAVRWFDRLPGNTLSGWLSLFSAVCGAACVGLTVGLMSRVRYRGLSVDAPPRRAVDAARARRLSAWVAGLYLACSIPFWVASTRTLPATFYLLLLLLAAGLFSQYQQAGKIRYLAALGFLYGLGITVFATFLLYLPVAVFLVMRDLLKNRNMADGRRHLAFWGCLLAGLLLYPLQAGWLAHRFAALGQASSLWLIWGRMIQEQMAGLFLVRLNRGFIALMVLAIVPWMMIFCLSRRSPWFYDLDQILVRFVFMAGLLAVLYNAPFAFWNFLGIHYLMLTPHLLLAACCGYVTGEFWILGGCPLPTDAKPIRKIVRGASRVLAVLMPGLVLAGGVYNWPVTNARSADGIHEAVFEILDRVKDRDILLTNGVLDDMLRLAARDRRQKLVVLNVQQMDSPIYLRRMAAQFPDPAQQTALQRGDLNGFLDELLLTDPGLARTAVLGMADVFRPYGHLVPDALIYRLVPDIRQLDLAALAGSQRGFQEMMARMQAQPLTERNLVWPYRQYLLDQAATMANNLGVLQAAEGDFSGATDSFRAALRINSENLSAWMNLQEMARAGDLPEWETMEAEWPEQMQRGRSTHWALSVRHGYLWNADEWVQRGYVWALSGIPAVPAGYYRRSSPADLDEVAQRQFLDLVYGPWKDTGRNEFIAHSQMIGNERNTAALMELCRLAIRRNHLEVAEAYILEALRVGLDERDVAFERVMITFRRAGKEEALAGLQVLVRDDPADFRAWLALALLTGKGSALNRRAMSRIMDLDPDDTASRMAVAWLYMSQRKWDQAEAVLEAAAHSEPHNLHMLELMFVLAQIRNNPRWVQATRRELLERDRDHPLRTIQAVAGLIQEEDWAAAEARLRNALRRKRNPDLLYALANIILERDGDLDEARALIDEALVRQPFNPAFQCARSELNRQAGRFKEAEKELISVLWGIPEYTPAWLLLGELYLEQGNTDKIRKVVRMLSPRRVDLSLTERDQLERLEKAARP